jgi:hypothetical protein
MKNLTTVRKETRPERAGRLRAAIIELLKCRDDQYNEFQFQSGTRYLQTYLHSDPAAADALCRSRVFWNWWKNHWTNRDESFLDLRRRYPVKDREMILQLYLQYNSGKTLAEDIHPHSSVLNESYAEMITEVVTIETKKQKVCTKY